MVRTQIIIALLQLLIIAPLAPALPSRKPVDQWNHEYSLKERSAWFNPQGSIFCTFSTGSASCGRGSRMRVDVCRESCVCSVSGDLSCSRKAYCIENQLEQFCEKLCMCSSPPPPKPNTHEYARGIIKGNPGIHDNRRASSHVFLGGSNDLYDDEDEI